MVCFKNICDNNGADHRCSRLCVTAIKDGSRIRIRHSKSEIRNMGKTRTTQAFDFILLCCFISSSLVNTVMFHTQVWSITWENEFNLRLTFSFVHDFRLIIFLSKTWACFSSKRKKQNEKQHVCLLMEVSLKTHIWITNDTGCVFYRYTGIQPVSNEDRCDSVWLFSAEESHTWDISPEVYKKNIAQS